MDSRFAMKKFPFAGWMLVSVMLVGVIAGVLLALVDIYRWGMHPVRLSAGIAISLLCFVCLIGIRKRKVFAKYLAIGCMILSAIVLVGFSLFILVVGQQEPDLMALARNGLLVSLFLFILVILFLFSRSLKLFFGNTGENDE